MAAFPDSVTIVNLSAQQQKANVMLWQHHHFHSFASLTLTSSV